MNKSVTKLVVLFGVAGVSLSAIFGRLITAPSLISAMYRMAFSAVFLLPVALLRCRRELKEAGMKNILLCILSGAFLGFHFAFYLGSLKYTSIASSTVLVDTEVLFVALVLLIFFRERIPRRGLVGIALTLMGSVVIAMGDKSGGSHIFFGDLLAIAGALCTTVYTLIGRSERKHLSTTAYTFIVYSSAAVMLLLVSVFSGTPLTGYPLRDYFYIFGMTVCCTFLGHSIFSWGLKYISAAFISTAKLCEPVFATVLGMLIFAEIPRWNQVIGGVVVIAGIILYLLVKEQTENEQELNKNGIETKEKNRNGIEE